MFVCIVNKMQWFYCFMHSNSYKGIVRENKKFKSVCFDTNQPLGHKLSNKLKKHSYPYNPIENTNLVEPKTSQTNKKMFMKNLHQTPDVQRVLELTPGHICKRPVSCTPQRPKTQVIKSIPPSPVVSFPFWGNVWEEDGGWSASPCIRLPSYDSMRRIWAMLLQTHPKLDRTEGQPPNVTSPRVPQPKNSRAEDTAQDI